MNPGLKHEQIYAPSIPQLALFTGLAGIGCVLLGYLILPVAAALYATLLTFENKNGRIFSYVIPSLVFIINILFNGFFSLEGLAYVAVGAVLYYLYKSGKGKGESAFYITSMLVIMMLISAVFLAFDNVGAIRISSVGEFYSEAYYALKNDFIDMLSSLKTVNADGFTEYFSNPSEAEAIFHSAVCMLLPFLILIAFLLCGITFKLFSGRIFKYSDEKEKIVCWNFSTSNTVAYFYLAVSVLSMLESGGAFALVITSLNLVFLAVFGYIGFRVVHVMISAKKGPRMATVVIIAAIVLLSSFAIQLLSYLGIYFTVMFNKTNKDKTPIV